MTADVFERERCYGLVMHQMKRLLAARLITTDEFREIEARFRAKYHPVTGSVLVETQLLCIENGVINGSGKEGSEDEGKSVFWSRQRQHLSPESMSQPMPVFPWRLKG